MKKLVPAALLVMVLIAAPVLAQETTSPGASETPPAPAESPPAPAEEPVTTPAALPPPETAPEPTPAPEPALTAPEPASTEPAPTLAPAPTPTEPEPAPAPELTPTPLPEAVLPEVSQENVEDQEAQEDAPEQEIKALEADDGELDQEVEDWLGNTANLRQRIEDQSDDAPSLQQRKADRRDNNDDDDDDDDDDNRPGRKDRDEKEDRDGGINQKTDQEAESGDVDQSVDISNTGDYAQQCVAVLQAANTGNAQNAPAFLQYSGDADDFEPGGIEIDISPQLVQDCRQIIRQTTVVNQLLPRPRAAGQPGTQRPGVVRAGLPPGFAGSGGAFNVPTRLGQPAIGMSGMSRIGQARVQPLNTPSAGRMLPRTGGPGTASLLTLGAGALLIAGGLLVRRISR